MTENMPDPGFPPDGAPGGRPGNMGDLASPDSSNPPPPQLEGPAASPMGTSDAPPVDPLERKQGSDDEDVAAEGRGVVPSANRTGRESSEPNTEESELLRPPAPERKDSPTEGEVAVGAENDARVRRMQPPERHLSSVQDTGGEADPNFNPDLTPEENARSKALEDNMNKLLNMGAGPEEWFAAAYEEGIPAEILRDHLIKLGVDKKEVFKAMQEAVKKQKELPTDFPEVAMEHKGLQSELKDALNVAKEAADMENGMSDEDRDAAADKAIEKAQGVLENMAKERKGIKRVLFDEEKGILRKERRVHRLVVVPGVTIIMALIISYAAIVHAVTKGTTTRFGKS